MVFDYSSSSPKYLFHFSGLLASPYTYSQKPDIFVQTVEKYLKDLKENGVNDEVVVTDKVAGWSEVRFK